MFPQAQGMPTTQLSPRLQKQAPGSPLTVQQLPPRTPHSPQQQHTQQPTRQQIQQQQKQQQQQQQSRKFREISFILVKKFRPILV
jgi:hypothetical protein